MRTIIRELLDKIYLRFLEIEKTLLSTEIANNVGNFLQLSRERAELEPIIKVFKDFKNTEENVKSLVDLLSDQEIKDLAEEEIKSSREYLQKLENSLFSLLLPKDPDDGRSVFLEIRAGAGGSESALFSVDLLRMYIRYAEQRNWKLDLISENYSELGGYKEVIARIVGQDVYNRLKFESGVHRVQRVPVTEAQGRVHTSTCTVAVMAEVAQVDEISIKPNDIRVDTFRASGAGGQHVNKTDSAVRITHFPTGLVVVCQSDRSQHRNKEKAIQILATRLKNQETTERNKKKSAERKFLVGSGDRSERVRTYNYSQGRITDHRINLTLYKLLQVMEGNLDELLDAILSEYQAKKISEIELKDS